jgi:protein Mpv17
MQSLLSGASVPEIIERIKNTVPTSWLNSCKVWPAITAFSFTYIPVQYRSIFGGVIAIGWQTYLSLLNQRAAAEEEAEHQAGHSHVQRVVVEQISEDRGHGREKQKCAA